VQVQPSPRDRQAPIAFLLHGSSNLAVFPLFSPPGAERGSVSIPFGRAIADLHVDIGAVGAARIYVALRSAPGNAPGDLRVSMSMLDMAMGTTASRAQKTGSLEYTAHVFFSMPGIWRLDLGAGAVRASAALLLGRAK
jgi:hypothetical protein